MPSKDSDLYDDSPAPTATSQGADEGAGDTDTKTSILPRSFFEGKELNPGDKAEVEIVAVHDNDYEVMAAGAGDDEDSEDEGMDQPGPSDDEAGAAQPTPAEDPNYS